MFLSQHSPRASPLPLAHPSSRPACDGRRLRAPAASAAKPHPQRNGFAPRPWTALWPGRASKCEVLWAAAATQRAAPALRTPSRLSRPSQHLPFLALVVEGVRVGGVAAGCVTRVRMVFSGHERAVRLCWFEKYMDMCMCIYMCPGWAGHLGLWRESPPRPTPPLPPSSLSRLSLVSAYI